MAKKKILIVYSGAKYQGGIEDYLENLFKFYDRKRVELILASLGEWPLCGRIRKAKGKVFVLPRGRIRPQTFFDLKKLTANENISLVVSQGVVANFYSRLGARLAGAPHLTAVHSDLAAEYSNPFIRSLYRLSDFLTRPFTKRYIAASKYLKKTLVQKRIGKDKITVIYDGVNPRTEGPKNRRTEERKSGRTEDREEIIIGSLGRLDKVKGYDNLIRAFSMLENTDAKLMIWGEGKERENLEALIKKLGLEDVAEMPGHIDPAEALRKMDIYIQPSRSEGLGLAVIEAMLAGKPVVVTPAGGLKEIVRNGETGIVAKSAGPKAIADAIKQAFDGFENVEGMIEKAREEAKNKFSAKRSAEETIKTYLETLQTIEKTVQK